MPPKHVYNYFTALSAPVGGTARLDALAAALESPTDVDAASKRLVIWADADGCCDHAKGATFFASSSATRFVSHPNCGHVVNDDGKPLLGSKVARIASDYLYGGGKLDGTT